MCLGTWNGGLHFFLFWSCQVRDCRAWTVLGWRHACNAPVCMHVVPAACDIILIFSTVLSICIISLIGTKITRSSGVRQRHLGPPDEHFIIRKNIECRTFRMTWYLLLAARGNLAYVVLITTIKQNLHAYIQQKKKMDDHSMSSHSSLTCAGMRRSCCVRPVH